VVIDKGAWTSNLRVPGIQLVRHGRGGRTTVGLSPLCPRKPTKCGVAVIDAKGLRAGKIYPQRNANEDGKLTKQRFLRIIIVRASYEV